MNFTVINESESLTIILRKILKNISKPCIADAFIHFIEPSSSITVVWIKIEIKEIYLQLSLLSLTKRFVSGAFMFNNRFMHAFGAFLPFALT